MTSSYRKKKCRSALPDCLVPYKHYASELIVGVLDDVVTPDDADTEDYPCEATMYRWKHWLMVNYLNMGDYLKSIALRLLGWKRDGSSPLYLYWKNCVYQTTAGGRSFFAWHITPEVFGGFLRIMRLHPLCFYFPQDMVYVFLKRCKTMQTIVRNINWQAQQTFEHHALLALLLDKSLMLPGTDICGRNLP